MLCFPSQKGNTYLPYTYARYTSEIELGTVPNEESNAEEELKLHICQDSFYICITE